MQFTKQPGYLGLVFAALVACSGKDPRAQNLSLQRRIAEIAGQASRAAPAEVDPNTRLDGAKAGPGLKLTSSYTLLNSESDGINSATFESKLTAVIKEGSCKNPDLRPLIDQGVVVVLEYRGKDGTPIATLSINRETCAAIR